MDTNDVFRSIKVALWEEQTRAQKCREDFIREDYTIFVTNKAMEHIRFGMYPLEFKRNSDEVRLFGCKVEMIGGDDLRMYLAKEIDVVEWSRMEEGE